MNRAQAEELYSIAQQCYEYGEFELALEHLLALDAHFPGNHRILRAQARTLAKLGRRDEALTICNRLLDEYQYEKIRPLRDRLAAGVDGDENDDLETAGRHQFLQASGTSDEEVLEKQSRFRIKPIRFTLLVLIVAAMYFQYISYWFGGGLIAAYFILKFAMGRLLMRLFTIPFRMKGKALAGAEVVCHGHVWSEPPKDDDADDDENEPKKRPPMRYAWVDVTITPKPRTQGFTHWEPGELMIAPKSMKSRGLDDMDHCYRIRDLRIFEDGKEVEDKGYKLAGPQRIKCLVEVPESESEFRFWYYGYTFGELKLT